LPDRSSTLQGGALLPRPAHHQVRPPSAPGAPAAPPAGQPRPAPCPRTRPARAPHAPPPPTSPPTCDASLPLPPRPQRACATASPRRRRARPMRDSAKCSSSGSVSEVHRSAAAHGGAGVAAPRLRRQSSKHTRRRLTHVIVHRSAVYRQPLRAAGGCAGARRRRHAGRRLLRRCGVRHAFSRAVVAARLSSGLHQHQQHAAGSLPGPPRHKASCSAPCCGARCAADGSVAPSQRRR
jgi:hypothetical protein